MKTLITPTLARKVESKLLELHGSRLKDMRFAVEGWLEETRVLVRFTLTRHDKSTHYPMEAGVALESDKSDEIDEALWLAVDFLGYYLAQYLESGGEVLLPLDWMAIPFGDRQVYARGWERNLALEEAADRWLSGEDVEVRECVEDKARRRRQH